MHKELVEMSFKELWELFPISLKEHNRDGYTAVKTELIARYIEKAKCEYGGRYIPSE